MDGTHREKGVLVVHAFCYASRVLIIPVHFFLSILKGFLLFINKTSLDLHKPVVKNIPIYFNTIQNKAKSIYNDLKENEDKRSKIKEFNARKGWFESFQKKRF